MEFLGSAELIVPVYQIALLLALSTVVMLFGKIKLALLVNYLFTMYWGYGFNRDHLVRAGLDEFGLYTALYFGFGMIIVILAIVGFFTHQE